MGRERKMSLCACPFRSRLHLFKHLKMCEGRDGGKRCTDAGREGRKEETLAAAIIPIMDV